MNKGDVVQFNENHKWCGCIGIINEKKEIISENPLKDDIIYLVGIPTPEGTIFIRTTQSENAIEYIGNAHLTPRDDD